jgi:hypothetical protein
MWFGQRWSTVKVPKLEKEEAVAVLYIHIKGFFHLGDLFHIN